jgi:hypothetical protein
MDNVHPLYRIIAVLCVGSVAKALFAPVRPASQVTTRVVDTVSDVAAERLGDAARHISVSK